MSTLQLSTEALEKKLLESYKTNRKEKDSPPELEIVEFKEMIETYFHDQARDYLHLMENTPEHSRLLTDKLGVMEVKP